MAISEIEYNTIVASMYLLPYAVSPRVLIPSCNLGRPLKEVTIRVKKQYPSVQLSAWMVCIFFSFSAGTCLSISLHKTFIKSDCSAVLADCWLDKPSVHAFAIPCDLPQLCCMLLVMFSCPEHSTRHVSQCPPLGESHLLSGHLVFPPVQGDISQPPRKGYVSEAGLDGIGGTK